MLSHLKKNPILVVLLLVLSFYVYKNYQGFYNNKMGSSTVASVSPNDDSDDSSYGEIGAKESVELPSCAQFVSSNLLPKDDPNLDSSFTEFSPAKDLEGQNFIDSNKYSIGMQSESLRNANYQLRSDPPITNTFKCENPWNNSTIEPENNRRCMDIGSPGPC